MSTMPWGELKKTADGNRKGLPPDTYTVMLTQATAGMSSNDNPKMDLRFKVDSGPYAGETIFHTLTLVAHSGFALANFFDSMAALGLPESRFTGTYTLEQAAAELMARTPRASIKTKVEEWNGRPRTKVDGVVMPIGGPLVASAESVTTPALPSLPPAAPALPEIKPEPAHTPVESPFTVAPRADALPADSDAEPF